MPSTLPLEIEETILDFLVDDKCHSALKTCSLVCQAFLPICRKHIFGSIVLNNHDLKYSSSIHAFDRLLHETPEIADYIRKLDFTILAADLTSPSIQESLKRISRLEFLTVQRFDWSNNPIRPALLHLLHLPTLTHFQVIGVKDFILSDLIPCVNLKYLHIGHDTTVAAENTFPATLPEHSIQLNEFLGGIRDPGPAVIMKFFTARRPDGQPIIDFGSLSKITMSFYHPNEGQELFRRCHALTSVKISYWNLHNFDDVKLSLADMLGPSMQTLKHIILVIHVIDDSVVVDPLCSISSEFEDMRTKNIIETITINIVVPWQRDACFHRGDDWGRLDSVLTAPGWFSLKRVSLVIYILGYRVNNDLDVILRNLRETQFLRLSSSNSVSFKLSVDGMHDWINTIFTSS